MTTEEKMKVLEALHIIKRECRNYYGQYSCPGCELYDKEYDDCSVTEENPKDWELPPLPEKEVMFTV